VNRRLYFQSLGILSSLVFSPDAWTKQLPPSPLDPSAWAGRHLESILKLIEQGQLRLALEQARSLSERFPGYAPAQMVYADLLHWYSAKNRPVLDANTQMPLQNLQQEIKLRRLSIRHSPAANTLPLQVMSLGAHTKTLLAIDTAKARLHALSIDSGQIKVVFDFFVSVGRSGTDKQVEGDEKTPLGIYAITRKISPAQLRDRFFGAGALPVNYPNPFDRHQGKTGFGIWLHGSPNGQPSRPVFSTNGCIVLADSDMQAILEWTLPYHTPVIVGSNLVWRPHNPNTQNSQNTEISWNSRGREMRAIFDPAHRHAFERNMVRYEIAHPKHPQQWIALNR
jgi:L,D-transpeptidase YnhG